MTKVITAYRATGKLVEKYNVADALVEAGGGEYPTQDGFGWTNGVLRRLLALYPDAVAQGARIAWCASAPANDDDPPGSPPTEERPRSVLVTRPHLKSYSPCDVLTGEQVVPRREARPGDHVRRGRPRPMRLRPDPDP